MRIFSKKRICFLLTAVLLFSCLAPCSANVAEAASNKTTAKSVKRKKISVKKGKSKSITYDNTEFHPNYELYKWKILSGSDKIKLSGTKGKTCKVKGVKKGTAVIQITYNYGKDEPDVLTGIDRNADRTRTQQYSIKVTDGSTGSKTTQTISSTKKTSSSSTNSTSSDTKKTSSSSTGSTSSGKTTSSQSKTICTRCNGTGMISGSDCPACNGKGTH